MSSVVPILIREAAHACGVSASDVLGERRWAEVVEARHLAIWLTRQLTPLPQVRIGLAFNRDEATVLHSIRAVERRRRKDPDWHAKSERMLERLKPLMGPSAAEAEPVSPNSAHAPPLRGDETDWGFAAYHGNGRTYCAQQNEKFAMAMRAAGHKEGPPGVSE